VISFEHVTKYYAGGIAAVDGLTLNCPSGAITVLLGSSGSGKTTCLRMVNRLVEPTAGTVRIDGTDVASIPPTRVRRQIGYVIQQGGLFPHRTVLDNVATVPLLLGWIRRQARRRAADLLERVELPADIGARFPAELSGGQQQRVGVARALAADPPVLLMDEPFSAVDPIVRAEPQEGLRRLQQDIGKTIVFVTHDVQEATLLGDRIAVLKGHGQLAQVGPPEEVLARPADEFVASFLGLDRGMRRLSFISSATLVPDPGPVVALGDPLGQARSVAEAHRARWLVVVDKTGSPVGWLGTDRPAVESSSSGVTAGDLAPLGHSFQLGRDSLRTALHSAVLSPALAATAVDSCGQFLGLVPYQDIFLALGRASTETPVSLQMAEIGS
jgi:osmoprotectant transport system ATP-binding protein